MSVNHYENFPVASLLCPPALRPAIRAIYAYARTADDLADEGDAAPAQRLADLDAYRAELHTMLGGGTPAQRWREVFEPLRVVVERHALPPRLLEDLLDAFRQDVTVHRYAQRAELLDYCRRSANPVGRLLLHLYRIDTPQALHQSDDICTALQLANFWQDFGVDLGRGRLYVPQADIERYRVDPQALRERADDPAARALFAELIGWTRAMMLRGAPLVHQLPGRIGWELRLVVQGGLRILEKVEALPGTPLHERPVLRTPDVLRMAWRALGMRADTGLAAGRTT